MELGHLCSIHMDEQKPLTKLAIIQEAVNVITNLEQRVRGEVSVELLVSVSLELKWSCAV